MSQIPNPPKKRTWQYVCLIAILLLGVMVWFNIPTPLRISAETTYILGPMMPDGKRIDYFRAMEERFYPPEMKTDDNGYRILARALGRKVWRRETTNPTLGELFSPASGWLQICEKLGLDPNEEPATSFKIESPRLLIDPSGKFWVPSMPFWTFEDYPMLKDWLEENTEGIDLLAEAVRKPVFFIPFVHDKDVPLFHTASSGAQQDWAEAVHARAAYRLGIGDIDGAVDDIVTLHRLARHIGKQMTLLSWVLGGWIEDLGSGTGIGSNPKFSPTAEQIERLITELKALPPRQPLSEILEMERYQHLARLQYAHYHSKSRRYGGTLFARNRHWLMDINVIMETINKDIDKKCSGNLDIEERNCSWNPLPYLFIRSRTDRIVRSMIDLSLVGVQENRRSIECRGNMYILTLALLLYEKDHGTLPDGDWREAVRPYLGENSDKYFRCPSYRELAEGETTYAMIGGVPNPVASPNQILIVEVFQPQKLGEGEGRFPFDKAVFGNKRDDGFDGLGSRHAGGINVGLRSGAVIFTLEVTKPDELRQLFDGTATTLP